MEATATEYSEEEDDEKENADEQSESEEGGELFTVDSLPKALKESTVKYYDC